MDNQPSPDLSSARPLPPLPDLSAAPNTGGASSPAGPSSFLAQIMSGIAPVKKSVDSINLACKQIVQSGTIPGAEQICAQIIALASGLLPMAVQNSMGPGGPGAGPGGPGPGGMTPLPPPPGGPQPILGKAA